MHCEAPGKVHGETGYIMGQENGNTTRTVDAHELQHAHADALDIRALGEWLSDNLDDMPAGWQSTTPTTTFVIYADDSDDFALLVKWLARGTTVDAPLSKEATDYSMAVTHMFGRFGLRVMASRSDVCERVQVGTRSIEVPDPNADPVPTIIVDEPVYEWRCTPALDAATEHLST